MFNCILVEQKCRIVDICFKTLYNYATIEAHWDIGSNNYANYKIIAYYIGTNNIKFGEKVK